MRLTTPFAALKLFNQGYSFKQAIAAARNRPTKSAKAAIAKQRQDAADYVQATTFIGPKGYVLNRHVWTFEKFISARDKSPGVSLYDLQLPKVVRFAPTPKTENLTKG